MKLIFIFEHRLVSAIPIVVTWSCIIVFQFVRKCKSELTRMGQPAPKTLRATLFNEMEFANFIVEFSHDSRSHIEIKKIDSTFMFPMLS